MTCHILSLSINIVAPEVIVEQPVVHTKSGLEAKLECIVFSHPTATIHWFHSGKPLLKINNHIATKDNDLVSLLPCPASRPPIWLLHKKVSCEPKLF
jgi:hypothetical protein